MRFKCDLIEFKGAIIIVLLLTLQYVKSVLTCRTIFSSDCFIVSKRI